jgi:succinate dehydrogenase (ubiquinone) membrane anchor subunit
LGLVGAALISPHKAVDFALGVVLPLHCHLGFDSVIVDYLPKRKFPTIYPLVKALLYIATAGTLYGLYQYNTKDVGISEGFGRLWNAPKKQDNEK